MATSSISIDVKAANSKLAQYLRRIEEEEKGLQVGKRKPKQLQDEKLPTGRGRWKLEPDYRAPSPMVDRPRTAGGATSFHFSYITVSKTGVPTAGGKPLGGTFGTAKNAALDHSKYIERDGAAERSPGAQHATYVERPGAVEQVDRAWTDEEQSRQLEALVGELPTSEEAAVLASPMPATEGVPSVLSNISSDPFERQEFWRAVERSERSPKSHLLHLNPAADSRWLDALAGDERFDFSFRNHILTQAEAYQQHLEKNPNDTEFADFRGRPFPASAEAAGRLLQMAETLPGYDHRRPPLIFKSGRGGRVQIRLVAELPHEVAAADRALIVQNFCDYIASLEERRDEAGNAYRTGLMFTAVIHAPDAHNDSRNYHLHLIAYDRPARFSEEHNAWDFEVAEHFNHKGEDRVRYPHRQDKIQSVTRREEWMSEEQAERAGQNFIPSLRKEFARITNTVLKARGVERRIDPRRYVEMGIDRTPTDHLGTKAAALESIGVVTKVGLQNATAIWSDAERSIKRQAVEARKGHLASQTDFMTTARKATGSDPKAPELARYRTLLVERESIVRDVAEDRELIMTFDHMEAKAKSRAIRTRQTCLQLLADIENGVADATTASLKFVIQDRWRGAQAHIMKIDEDLAPHRPALSKAAEDIEKREARLREIDQQLQPLRDLLGERASRAVRNSPGKEEPAIEKAPDAVVKRSDPAALEPLSQAELLPQSNVQSKAASPAPIPVQVEPTTIEGLPITEPTIGPRQDVDAPVVTAIEGTPEGLEPVRPTPQIDVAPAGSSGEVILDADCSGTEEVAAPDRSAHVPSDPADAVADRALTSPQVRDEITTNPPVGSAPKPVGGGPATDNVDGRKKPKDPTLFPLPEQVASVKTVSSNADYQDFDNLINRISSSRTPIAVEVDAKGITRHVVPTLTPDEQTILTSARFGERANKRLAAIYDTQQQEINRLIRWIRTHGQEDQKLLLIEEAGARRARLGPGLSKAVHTLFRHWSTAPEAVAALLGELERRNRIAKQIAEIQPTTKTAAPARANEPEAAGPERYPLPEQAKTDQVRVFIKLLRSDASPEQLSRAASRIQKSSAARAEINELGVELATVYRQHQPGGMTPPQAYQDRRGFER